MNLSDIITKCYILALIIRDDGERLLLGDGNFEFKSSLQHFAPNIYQNDIVELQGTDGQLLAGQVRRSATQAFDGYIADGTIGKTDTEQSRRRFLGFFRKKHHYKVVYIMPDGTAVQRDRGYIVDAPAVQELYQRFPEYHIGLNFEDPNYYEYSENDEGEEIYTHIQAIALFRELEAGLVWDAFGAVSDDIAWTEYMTKNSTDGYILIGNGLPVESPLSLTHLYGNATQTTYTGKNLMPILNIERTINNVKFTPQADGSVLVNGTNNTANYAVYVLTFNTAEYNVYRTVPAVAGTYYISNEGTIPSGVYVQCFTQITGQSVIQHNADGVFTVAQNFNFGCAIRVDAGTTVNNLIIKPMVEKTTTKTSWEPYVGSTSSAITPSPNPDYPQEIKTVSGLQTVRITGKNLLMTDRTLGAPSNTAWGNSTKRLFDFDEYIAGITRNNYYSGPGAAPIVKGDGTYTVTSLSGGYGVGLPIELSPNTDYIVSADITNQANAEICVGYYQLDGTYIGMKEPSRGHRTFTFTTPSNCAFVDIILACATNETCTYSNIQLELGSTATAYEPYQGQEFEVDLGSLELAKIGTYQDYIWNDEGTWKIHQAVGKYTFTGNETGQLYAPTATYTEARFYGSIGAKATELSQPTMSEKFSYITNNRVAVLSAQGSSDNNWYVRVPIQITVSTLDDMRAIVAGNSTYYALATPTDTEITDSELIAQLNHIYELYQGQNNLWLIPSAGAQGEMTVRFGVAYDDDGSGYHWSEEIGSPDNIITNDGIDSVRPIWTINGPATNPTLTNITTAQTIAWNGTVPADSTLIIDMERQTATLNGANVYAQIEGDWLELAVGPNKLQYNASGGATDDSTLEWNGVLG